MVSRSCQQSQIRVSQDEAIATATAAVNFKPDDSIVRLLRQGISTKPYWVVVLYKKLAGDLIPRAQVYIDAKSGKVTKLTVGRGAANARRDAASGGGGGGKQGPP